MDTEKHDSMMDWNGRNILFVDDEFSDPTKVQLHGAVNKLREQGCQVDTFTTMGEALDAFMTKKFYHVMIIDVDMARTLNTDAFQKAEGTGGAEAEKNGADLAQAYIALDNGCRMIVYSGAGTHEDMFKLANSHVYGYVRKGGNGVEKLVKMVDNACQNTDMGIRLPMPRTSGKVLVMQTQDSPMEQGEWERIISNLPGSFSAAYCTIGAAANQLEKTEFAVVVLAARSISPHDVDDLRKVCAVQPRPHVVLACNISRDNEANIIDAVNLRPLRLVNLLSQNREQELTAALQSALNCYDGWETFESSLNYIHQVASNIDWEVYQEDDMALTEEIGDDFPEDDMEEPWEETDAAPSEQ